jgi:hypothetical protein
LQNTGRRPRRQTATQGGARDTARSSSKCPPLHTLSQKEREAGNDVFARRWRTTKAVRQWQDLVNQPGNQINRRNGWSP